MQYPMAHTTMQVHVRGFEHLDFLAKAIQTPGEPSTGLAFLDLYSIIVLGDLSMVIYRVVDEHL